MQVSNFDLPRVQPMCPIEVQPVAYGIFASIFSSLESVEWRREGSLAVMGDGRERIGFGARKFGCSIHFRGVNAIEFYRSLGGICECGRVTIKIPYGTESDAELISHIVKVVSGNSS